MVRFLKDADLARFQSASRRTFTHTRVLLIAPRPRAFLSFLVPFLGPLCRTDGAIKLGQRFALFRALAVFGLALVKLVVPRVAVLRLVRLRDSRIKRRRLQL